MKTQGYWPSASATRLSRRRVIAATGAASAAGLLLAACGGAKSAKVASSSPLAVPVDRTQQAKPGGVMKLTYSNEVNSWDPHVTGTWWSAFGGPVLSRLFRVEAGVLKDSDGTMSGELVDSWEYSPDRLTMTAKLRANMPWHPIAPVNARPADSADVVFSWNRFLSVGTNRVAYANSLSPDSPILSVTAPDKGTVVIKLAYPMVTLPAQFALIAGGSPHIVPREADGGFDLRRQIIGTGPFYVSEHTPSVSIKLKKNPGYYLKDRPLVDSVEYPIVPEYATALAQFKAGGVYVYAARQEDILALKRDVSALILMKGDMNSIATNTFFGYKPTDKSVFRDIRLRQAYSMSWDRDQYIDVLYNVSDFRNQGIPVETSWNSAIQNNLYQGWWLDPQSKDFGPNAKYYQRDIAEAKKLISAAGYANGVDVMSNYITSSEYGTDYLKSIEILEGMNAEAGFRFAKNIVNYQTEFVPKFRDASGNFEGLAYRRMTPSPNDNLELIVTLFSKTSGVPFMGFDTEGKGNFAGDPYIEDQVQKARREVDANTRRSIVLDLQRYLAKQSYYVKWPGGATGLDIVWPAVNNYRVYHNESRSNLQEWLDESAAPLKRA